NGASTGPYVAVTPLGATIAAAVVPGGQASMRSSGLVIGDLAAPARAQAVWAARPPHLRAARPRGTSADRATRCCARVQQRCGRGRRTERQNAELARQGSR